MDTPTSFTSVAPAAQLRGRLRLPGDKSITHRALLLAGMAAGRSTISGASDALDPRSTARCLAELGVRVDQAIDDDGFATYRVESPGISGWQTPSGTLDCGNSGTTLRMLTGILAGSPIGATLDGDDSLRSRPVARIVAPLRAMGANVHARADDSLPPVTVRGSATLVGVDHAPTVPSAQVKSAILLAGLAAVGTTVVRESVATRDHTERMLRGRGVAIETDLGAEPGSVVISLAGEQHVAPLDEQVTGDVSSAVFWLVAGACHRDAELTLEGVGVNPTRRRALDLLLAMGARITERDASPAAAMGTAGAPESTSRVGEPQADLTVRSSDLEAIDVSPIDVAAAIDEIPVLCLAAACARGTTRIRGAGELRFKESDRLAGIAEGLNALGARVTIEGDDLVIVGGAGQAGFGLRGGEVRTHDDHRLAMTYAVAGLIDPAPVRFDGRSAAVSYPTFFRDLERIRA
ncbi:MAG TPA: 3-phosphoshikimate 1-carboxyvinyltransferase [Candidatus Limnocylindrales bacterium]